VNELEPIFPIEFVVKGTPVSAQSDRADSREQWKTRVREASKSALPEYHFATERRVSVTLYYFPADEMEGDVDNIIKLVLDACSKHIYLDDHQVERVVVQKFEPGRIFSFSSPSPVLEHALSEEKPLLFVRISDEIHEGLK